MSYFPVGHRFTAGEIDDFDDCDPAHYTGGYDIDLTYGRSLPPSYEICYPIKTSASDHRQFASHPKPSAYAVEALGNEYNSYSRPGHPASAGGHLYSGPKPNYGFQPGGRNEYARPEPGYGSWYSTKPPSSKFGSSHEGSSEYENPRLMDYNPGRKPDYGESGYGPGMREPVSDFGSGYGGRPEKPTYPRPSYPEPSYPFPSYPEPSDPFPRYPEPSYPFPSYPEPSFPIPRYPEPSYPTPGYGPQKYERHNSDYEERKHHHSHGRRQ